MTKYPDIRKLGESEGLYFCWQFQDTVNQGSIRLYPKLREINVLSQLFHVMQFMIMLTSTFRLTLAKIISQRHGHMLTPSTLSPTDVLECLSLRWFQVSSSWPMRLTMELSYFELNCGFATNTCNFIKNVFIALHWNFTLKLRCLTLHVNFK